MTPLSYLKSLGPHISIDDFGVGYSFSKPVPAADCERMLREGRCLKLPQAASDTDMQAAAQEPAAGLHIPAPPNRLSQTALLS